MGKQVTFRLDREAGLDIVIDRAGSLSAIAKVCGVSRPAISKWRRVPIGRVAILEKTFGIPRSELRPDVFSASE